MVCVICDVYCVILPLKFFFCDSELLSCSFRSLCVSTLVYCFFFLLAHLLVSSLSFLLLVGFVGHTWIHLIIIRTVCARTCERISSGLDCETMYFAQLKRNTIKLRGAKTTADNNNQQTRRVKSGKKRIWLWHLLMTQNVNIWVNFVLWSLFFYRPSAFWLI